MEFFKFKCCIIIFETDLNSYTQISQNKFHEIVIKIILDTLAYKNNIDKILGIDATSISFKLLLLISSFICSQKSILKYYLVLEMCHSFAETYDQQNWLKIIVLCEKKETKNCYVV